VVHQTAGSRRQGGDPPVAEAIMPGGERDEVGGHVALPRKRIVLRSGPRAHT